MTILNTYQFKDESPLEEFLIKNLPAKIKAGTQKDNSNIFELDTIRALRTCPFINFNTQKQISIMVFDIDSYDGITAKEYFKDIDGLFNHITDKIGHEPTYILETNKGFHFGYGLMNHVFTNQPKAVSYIRAIKIAIAEILGCDPHASNRLNGVWRNPLLHNHYFSGKINYELKDFNDFLPKKKKYNKNNFSSNFDIDKINFQEGNRNNNLFYCGLVYANNFLELTEEQVFQYLKIINDNKNVALEIQEIKSIANSIYYRYWKEGKILLKKDVNVGAMEFEKISNLTKEEYDKEVKKRQSLSAQRTLEIRNFEKNELALKKANSVRIKNLEKQNIKIVNKTIKELIEEDKKITVSAISLKSGLNRRTVAKYLKR